jgi:hypothetical protein
MINEIGRYRADGAQAAVIEGRVTVTLDFQQDAVSHMQQNTAPAMAAAANTFKNFATRLLAVLQRRRGWLSDIHACASKDATATGPILNKCRTASAISA